jgi:hypothetical protein
VARAASLALAASRVARARLAARVGRPSRSDAARCTETTDTQTRGAYVRCIWESAENPKRIAYPWPLARGDTVILTENAVMPARFVCKSLRDGSQWQCRMAASPWASRPRAAPHPPHSHCAPPSSAARRRLLAGPDTAVSARYTPCAPYTSLYNPVLLWEIPMQLRRPGRARALVLRG